MPKYMSVFQYGTYIVAKLHFFAKKYTKYLHISKKSRTFAVDLNEGTRKGSLIYGVGE